MVNTTFFDETTEQSLVKTSIVAKYFWVWAKVIMSIGQAPWSDVAGRRGVREDNNVHARTGKVDRDQSIGNGKARLRQRVTVSALDDGLVESSLGARHSGRAAC